MMTMIIIMLVSLQASRLRASCLRVVSSFFAFFFRALGTLGTGVHRSHVRAVAWAALTRTYATAFKLYVGMSLCTSEGAKMICAALLLQAFRHVQPLASDDTS